METVLTAGKKLKINNLIRRKRPKSFFLKNAKFVAKNILGDLLVLKHKNNIFIAKIVETEAYLGIEDDASHSFKAKITPRNRLLYKEGAKIYVYLIYGKYWCFNIVASKENDPQAVFIRALAPQEGILAMQKRRGTKDIKKLTNGPCRWTESFGIDKSFLGKSIISKDLFIAKSNTKKFDVVCKKRIGVEYAAKSKDLPLRFYIKDNPFVSKR
jgi:DNA-3-methyladenine glycosylase